MDEELFVIKHLITVAPPHFTDKAPHALHRLRPNDNRRHVGAVALPPLAAVNLTRWEREVTVLVPTGEPAPPTRTTRTQIPRIAHGPTSSHASTVRRNLWYNQSASMLALTISIFDGSTPTILKPPPALACIGTTVVTWSATSA
ncbi:MAG: hypothetical protein SPK00_12290 [Corynebacterium glucuronolyticum]|nr:hypothetical protein [Mycobacteriaceae bacterium]MDY5835497.1 hypothetical protein [Corynebacterium glucuronolyticum]